MNKENMDALTTAIGMALLLRSDAGMDMVLDVAAALSDSRAKAKPAREADKRNDDFLREVAVTVQEGAKSRNSTRSNDSQGNPEHSFMYHLRGLCTCCASPFKRLNRFDNHGERG